MHMLHRHSHAGARVCALALLVTTTTLAQDAPQLLRVAYIKIDPSAQAQFEASSKMLMQAYKKAGIPWREMWTTSIAGEVMYVGVMPVKNMAQFDGQAPTVTGMSEPERAAYFNLSRSAIKEIRYVIIQTVPELSIMSGRKEPPKFARVTNVTTQAGKALDFEDLIKSTGLPALRKAGAKDYWVHRNVVGGSLGAYTTVQLFDKFEELDKFPQGPALFGGLDGYKAYLAKIAATAASADNLIARLIPELSYFSGQ